MPVFAYDGPRGLEEIHYLESREDRRPPGAERVVLLHSSGIGAGQWRRLIARLGRQFHVVAPDLLGYGRNPPWPETLAFHHDADIAMLEAFIAQLGGPVRLAGHSYGGHLALCVAARGQVEVSALALYEPVSFGLLDALQDAEGLGSLGDWDAFFSLEAGMEAWLERFVHYWNGDGAWAAMPEGQKSSFRAAARKTWAEVRSVTYEGEGALRTLRASQPTLLLEGDRSPVAERRVCALLAEGMANAQLQTLEGAGHMGPLTHNSEVNGRIASFFGAG